MYHWYHGTHTYYLYNQHFNENQNDQCFVVLKEELSDGQKTGVPKQARKHVLMNAESCHVANTNHSYQNT